MVFALVLGLSVAVPGDPVPARSGFPLSWLWSWLRAQPGWAATAFAGVPSGPAGPAANRDHYVSTDATRADGGAGRAPGKGIGALPEDIRATPAVTPSTTPALAGDHSFDPRTSVRVASAATATSDVYRNQDGSYTRQVYPAPVNYQAADGSWQPIDRDLVRAADGRLRQRANSVDVSFAGRADRELAAIRLGPGHAVAYSLAGAQPATAEVSGDTATYREVMAGVDLRLTMTASGVKESLVLHSADTPTSWLFPLRLTGLTPQLESDGSVTLRDAAGTVRATIPRGYMEDSRFDPESGEFTRSWGVSYELTTVDGAAALRVSVDADWLRDPARVFPVTVDPTTNFSGTSDTFARNDWPGDNSGSDELLVGTYNGGTSKAYSFIHFAGFGNTYAGSPISGVSLRIFLSWAYTCTAKPFSVNPVTQSWTASKVTSYPGPSFGAAIGSLTADPGVACTNTSGDRSIGTWMTVPLSVDTFKNWANGGTNNGLAVTASQTDSMQWKRFTSLNGPAGKGPYLQVTYTAGVAPQVDAQYPPAGYASPTLTPELLVAAHDPDNYPSALTYNFLVYDSAGTKVADSGWVSSRSWVVPAGILKWGQSYSWTVGAKDGVLVSTSQKLNGLSTTVPQPLVTSGLAQNGGRGFEPSVGNYTTTATDAAVATVGPALSVERAYNSQDPRTGLAFGAGWSSLFDARVTEQKDVAGALQLAVVTYPGGQEVAFGRNSDGTFISPSGRFATFTAISGGYRLVDKDGTTYTFTSAGPPGRFGLTSVADAQGRSLTLSYDTSGRPVKAISASGRALTLSWSTPAGASVPHVASVTTDPATPGEPATALTWTYSYSGDLLTKVCPPTSSTACTTYTYGTASRYPSAVGNAGPRSYWRLGDAAGPAAASAVLDNQGTDSGTYTDVALGQAGPLPGSTATAAGFNGTSSRVQLPSKLVTNSSYQAISLWFKTTATNGVLFSYQADPLGNATTPGNYTPALYVGSSGRLYGEFWYSGGTSPIVSPAAVNDGAWHHVVLSAAGNVQHLYLDGVLVGSKSGLIQMINAASSANVYVGAGFLGGNWPDQPHNSSTDNTGYATFFAGSVAEVGFFDKPLTGDAVAAIQATGRAAARPLTSVVRPSGNPSATIAYDPVTGLVNRVTDSNGGVWQIAAPVVSGSSQAYAGAVLAGGPADYWRLAETGTVDAINEVNGNTATYNLVTLGTPNGPFADATVAAFNGSSSYLKLPAADIPKTGPMSVSMWFKMPAGSTAGGVIFGYQGARVEEPTASGEWVPAIYVGTDGKLRGQLWTGSVATMTASKLVNDGQWHHVTLAASTNSQSLYLDGARVATVNAAIVATNAAHVYVGAGKWSGLWPAHSAATIGYFPGSIAEVAYYRGQLSEAQVAAQFAARDKSAGLPVRTVVITDPGGKRIEHVYDVATGRQLAETDALGNKTQYGYDVGGFLRTITDPNGNVTTNEHDVRGNVVSQTTCQNRAANKCSTVYYTYYPDATSTVLAPDPRNDVLLTERDARSASATDNTYLTSYGYDATGNRISVTDPLGRVTATAYTDGTTVAALDGGYAPAGLPMRVTTPGGATQKVEYYRSGDVARVSDPAGKVTTFTYDGLGRVLTETETTDTFPGGLTTSYRYDGQGRVVSQTEPAVTNRVTGAVHTAVTTTEYDVDGLVTRQTVADTTGGDAPRSESSTYNRYGQQETSTDSAGKTTRYEYDAYGNLVKETEPDGGVTTSTYDAEGNLLTTTVVGFTGNPDTPEPARDLVVTSYAYDPAGRLASETDAMGWVTAYTYTDNGLRVKTTRSDGTNSFVLEQNTYDAAGNLVSQIGNGGATTVTSTVDAAGRVTSSTVDPAGLKRTTSYEYSRDDHVVATTMSDAAGTLARTETLYDPMGRPVANTVHNGLMAPLGRWRLNDGSGTKAADSAGNSPATATDVTWSTARGGSAVFNGTTSVIETPGPVVDTARSFTVSAWAYLTDGTRNAAVFGQDGAVEGAFYLKYDQVAGNKWSWFMSDKDELAGVGYGAVSSTTAALNTWTHLVGVFDADARQLRLYVNGQLAGSRTLNASHNPWTSYGPFTVGRLKYDGRDGTYWPGSISDVQAYSRALSASEISGIYGGTAPAAGAGVVRTSWTLDQDGLATSETDPNGNVTAYEYDEDGERVVTVSPAVAAETNGGPAVQARPVTYVGYNTFGEQVETKDANGNVTVVSYDAAGRVASTRLPSYTPPGSSTAINAVHINEYDQQGQLVAATDPLGRVTRYGYDQLGRLTKVTAPDLGETRYTYDLIGNRLSTTDPEGGVTTSTYDYLGRMLTSTDVVRQTGANHTTVYTYGTGGWLSQTRSPAGVVEKSTYNAVGEPVTATDGANNVTTYTYDGLGRRVKTTLPDGTYTTTTYDMAGRDTATRSYSAAGAVLASQTTEYDADGNVLASTDARNTRVTFSYDASGMVVAETQPISATDAITTTFGYDLAGNRTRFTDGRGNAFVTTYTSWNLPETQIEPATSRYPNLTDRSFTVAYDAAAQVASQILPGGVRITNTYDPNGNLTKQVGTGAEVPTTDRTFGYDRSGRLISASAPGGTNTFSYDDRDLLLSATGPSGAARFSYNGDGELTSRVDAAGTTDYSYDTAGRVSTVANTGSGVQLTLGYNTLSQVSSIVYGGTGNRRALSYDDLHRLTADELKTPTGTTIAKISYGYDPNGNLTGKTTVGFAGSAANTYTYDLADRLLSWNNGSTTTTYAYDKSGNRTQVGATRFTYDERNQLVTGDGASYTYTPRGTLSMVVTGTGGYATRADAFGQVLRQEAEAGAQDYQYDALGRLVRPGFAYSGLGNTLAADGTATYTRDADEELLGVSSGGSPRLAWIDLHTDVVGQLTATGTTLSGSTAYDPLGKVIATAQMLGNLGFQSEWTDFTTGRVNMWSRWYNTMTGQFDTRDPIDADPVPDSVQANRFAYADDNPLTVTDPTGHWGFSSLWKKAKAKVSSAWHATTSYVSRSYSYARSYVSRTYKAVKKTVSRAYKAVKKKVSKAYHSVKRYVKHTYSKAKKWVKKKYHSVKRWVKKTYHKAKKWVAHKVAKVKKAAKWAYHKVKQAGKKVIAKTVRVAKKVGNAVKDAYNATEKWVKDHKNAIIEAVAIGGAILAGIACTAATAGAGAVACMVGAAAVINLAKDAAQGDIRNWGDAFGSLGTGALQGLAGGVGGAIGGKVAGALAGKMGSFAGSLGGRMISGATAGGVGDAVTQFATTGRVDLRGVAMSAGIGAVFGGVSRSGGRGASQCHSFDPNTRVLMADGTRKAIKDVKVGEKVAATEPRTGKTEAKPVTALHLNRDKELTDLTVRVRGAARNSSGSTTTTTLKTTQNHPFWDKTAGAWVIAAALVPGHELVGPNGETAVVESVRNFAGEQEMRDLTVADTHTYHVLADDEPVLVHNNNASCPVHGPTSIPGTDPSRCTCHRPANVNLSPLDRQLGRVRLEDTTARVGDPLEEPRTWGIKPPEREWGRGTVVRDDPGPPRYPGDRRAAPYRSGTEDARPGVGGFDWGKLLDFFGFGHHGG